MNRSEYLEKEYRREKSQKAGILYRLEVGFCGSLPPGIAVDAEILELAIQWTRRAFYEGELFAFDHYIAMQEELRTVLSQRIPAMRVPIPEPPPPVPHGLSGPGPYRESRSAGIDRLKSKEAAKIYGPAAGAGRPPGSSSVE
jgi:hypothetical protein